MPTKIEQDTLNFLQELSENNYREWFNENKDRYLVAHENMISFADDLLAKMQKHDFIETMSGKRSLMRIYRDTRFSKDKTPYKDHFGGGFRRATKRLRGGYYFEIGYNGALVSGGFFSPNKDDLLRIRKDIDLNYREWEDVMYEKNFRKIFGKMRGAKLTLAPRGFSIDHLAIELLRHKQFYFERRFSREEILSGNLVAEMNKSFKCLRPYFDFMSDILTTDGNGVSLVD